MSHTACGVIRQNIGAGLGETAPLAIRVPIGLVSVAVAVVVDDTGMGLGVTNKAMCPFQLRRDRFDVQTRGPTVKQSHYSEEAHVNRPSTF